MTRRLPRSNSPSAKPPHLGADDALATICINQANVALIRHRYEQALALAERSVTLHEGLGQRPGLAVALATLGQICVRVGNLTRAEAVLHRALEVRSSVQFHETTGAVYDTLAQMSLMRGDYENAAEYLQRAADAYGAYGRQTSRWYEWSVRVITARLAIRRGAPDEALQVADEIARAPAAPPAEALRGRAHRDRGPAGRRTGSTKPSSGFDRSKGGSTRASTPGAWGEFLRLRGQLRTRQARTTEAYHDIAQSSSVFELVGERYQAAVSQLALGRLASDAGARSTADRHFQHAAQVFESLGATRDLERPAARCLPASKSARASTSAPPPMPTTRWCAGSWMPRSCRSCLARELGAALSRLCPPTSSVVFVELPVATCDCIAHAGADADGARAVARLRPQGAAYARREASSSKTSAASRTARASWQSHRSRPLGHHLMRRRSHDDGGRPAGVRSLQRPRSPDTTRRTDDGAAPRAAAAGLRVRQRRHESSRRIRSIACRATT